MVEEIKKEIKEVYDLNTEEGLIDIDAVMQILDEYNNQSNYKTFEEDYYEWNKSIASLNQNIFVYKEKIKQLEKYKSAWEELKTYIDTSWYTEGGIDDDPIDFKDTYIGKLIFEQLQELEQKYNIEEVKE